MAFARTPFERGLDAAVRFLGQRPRSEREIRRRLAREDLPPEAEDEVVERLRTWGLVDDQAFAAYWVEQRTTFRPRGARLLKAELRQKGVSGEVADEAAAALAETADEDAYRSAQKKARLLAGYDEQVFRQRLGQFLQRRGFGWDVITPTVERLWVEQQEQ